MLPELSCRNKLARFSARGRDFRASAREFRKCNSKVGAYPSVTIAVAETNAGNKVHIVGIVDTLSNDDNAVFQFKGSYKDQELSKYKSIRV